MSDLIFKPIVATSTMITFSIVCLVVIFLNHKHIINRVLIVLLLFIVSQRPMLANHDEIVYNMDLDILFVIDNTVSMNAVDVGNGTRLNAVKKDCQRLIKYFSGANYAVITYGNIAQVKYPFTDDAATISEITDKMKIIDPVYANGSTLDMPYDYMKMLLSSSMEKDKHKRIVFFMGDGELSSQEAKDTQIDKYYDLVDMINGGAILGYGTSEGAKIQITELSLYRNLTDSNGFLIDSKTKKAAISQMNENNLNVLANKLGLNYYHMTDFSILNNQLATIKESAMETDEDEKEKMDKDIYYYFSFALLVALLYELFYCRRNEQ